MRKVLSLVSMLAFLVLPAAVGAAEAPAVELPAPSIVAPGATPAPLFLGQYLCTCEVEDTCTFPPQFVLIGGYCQEGQGCRCSGVYDPNGCLTSFKFECTGSSEM